MLARPGEARKTTATTQQRRRGKVQEEDLEDVVRKLQRLPANKTCADCGGKLPQCVNLNHGTFVCMPCSGVHREFNHKIKGIGHSSFTPAEVSFLRSPTSGNEAVNSRYLAKYDARRDRMRQPDNSDMVALRAWIGRKYADKAWFSGEDVPPPPSGTPATKGQTPQTAPPGRRKIMPQHQVQQPQQQAADLFGFDSIPPSSGGDDWDAFGGSSQQSGAADPFGGQSSFQADFGSMSNPPAAAPAPAFQADFGQPTVVALPPTPQQSIFHANFEQNQANQSHMNQQMHQQQKQEVFHANFNQSDMQMQTSQQMQQQQNQGMFNANFDQQNQASQPHMQQVQGMMFNSNFGSSEMQMQSNHQQMQQQQNQGIQQMQQQGMFNANFDQSPVPTQQNLQMQQNNVNQGMNNFGNFTNQNVNMQEQQPNSVAVTMNQGSNNFGNFEANFDNPSSASNQPSANASMNFGNFNQMPQQGNTNMMPGGGMVQHVHIQSSDASAISNVTEHAPMPAQPPAPPSDVPLPTAAPENSPPPLNPNAFRSMDDTQKSAFDAFDNLSLEPTPGLTESSANVVVNASSAAPSEADKLDIPNVLGASSRGMGNASIPTSGTDRAVKLQETAMMLQSLSVEQLIQVQQFVSALGGAETSTGNDCVNENSPMGNMPQYQAGGMGISGMNMQHASMGGGMAMYYNMQNQNNVMGGMPNVSTQGSVGQSGVNGSSSNSMPNMGMNFNNQPSVLQQQHPTGMAQMQPMGMAPDVLINNSVEPSANSSVSNALPPVEKEGNPFDFY